MKIKFMVASNPKGQWALAGHCKMGEALDQLKLVATAGMDEPHQLEVIELDLDKGVITGRVPFNE